MLTRSHAVLVVLAVATSLCSPLAAQIPTVPTRPTPEDTVEVPPFRFEPPVSPLSALLRSMLLPGWGQAILDRRATGAFFVMFEGIAWGMTIKSKHQLNYLRRIESEAADAKQQEFEDWVVLIVFNHLVAGAEAFVGTYLWDFPPELRMRRMPDGRMGLGASIPLP
jgi:hypothetical protein